MTLSKSATLLLGLLANSVAHAERLDFERDKQLHLGVSFLLGAGFSTKLEPFEACGAALAVGFGKEVYDQNTPSGFSRSDLAYDALGSCAGAYLVKLFGNLGP